MIFHFYHVILNTGRVGVALNHGYMAVDMFFMLSGFVMAFTYQRCFLGGISLHKYIGFLYKRLSRIFPLYVFAVSIAVVLPYVGLAQPSTHTPSQLITNALMIQAWGLSGSIILPSWSTSTEFLGYLLFPILVIMTLRGSGPRGVVVGIACVALLVFVATRSDLDVSTNDRRGPLDIAVGTTVYPLLRCLSEFILGLLAYRATQVARIMRVAGWRFTADLLVLAIVGLLAVHGADLVIALLFIPLIISLATEASVTARLLGRPAIYWLGMISYSIYLMHIVVETAFDAPIQHVLKTMHVSQAYSLSHLAIVGLVIAISTLTFYGIEKPARNWFRTIAGLRRGAVEMNAGSGEAAGA